MISVSNHLKQIKNRGKKSLVLFITAGDQPLTELPNVLETLVEGGADLIEIGLPFSDPYGEGLTIQGSSQRSLANGTTTRKIFEAFAGISLPIPVVTMGYYNPVLRYGILKYASKLHKLGIGGSIISDLVPDEAEIWCKAAKESGVETIFLAAPTSTKERISQVCQKSTGFIYAVSRTGVTGAGQAVPPAVSSLVSTLKQQSSLPICVGFGISKPQHATMVCESADGAVVGSALVDLLHANWDTGKGAATIKNYVKGIKSAIS